MLIQQIISRAKQGPTKKIVYTEPNSPRVLEAATHCAAEGIADIVFVANMEDIVSLAQRERLPLRFRPFGTIDSTEIIDVMDGIIDTNDTEDVIREATLTEHPDHPVTCEVIDPKTSPLSEKLASDFFDLRKDHGLTIEQARELIYQNPIYFACMLVRAGEADGIVTGARHSTADVMRPALQTLKKPATSNPSDGLVSAFFLMEVPNCDYGANGVFLFADSGLNQDPTADQLSEIAASSAKSFEYLVDTPAMVAMLSYSTKNSASHADVDKVIEATTLAKQKYPYLNIDGEFQADAALDMRAASFKGISNPDIDYDHVSSGVAHYDAGDLTSSTVAGRANTLVFPNLDSGNISYKLVQYLAKAEAYGPITQGFAYPINDLSRGCTVDDIIGVTAITALQANAN